MGPTVVVSLCPSLDIVGQRSGMLFGLGSIGLLIGAPIAGALLRSGWLSLQSFCGGTLLAATLCLVAVKTVKDGWKMG